MGKYSEELKEKIIRLHLQEGRNQASLEQEFNIGRGTIYHWLKLYNKECQTNSSKAEERQEFESYLKLKRELEELRKENGELITEFNEELFFATVEKITINVDKSAIITFKNGTEIKI